MKSKISIYTLALVLGLLCCACGNADDISPTADYSVPLPEAAQTLVEEPAPTENLEDQMGFYVDGTTLYDANGNPFVMRGVNHMHAWYPDKLEVTARALSDAGCNCIRVVLSNGERWDRTEADTVEKIIELCKEYQLITILEIHDTTGSDRKESLLAAAQYFVDIRDVLIGQEDYVILNIANEWPGSRNSAAWKNAYMEAIPILREAGLAHTLMIDCAGGGQQGKCIADAGSAVFSSDTLGNVMFSVHGYGAAGASPEAIERNLRYATELGLCICAGEFGWRHSDGDVDEAFLMQYCEENEIGYLSWAWKGNADEAAYLDLALDWEGAELSAEWGETVINGPNGIRATAEICTVFSAENPDNS